MKKVIFCLATLITAASCSSDFYEPATDPIDAGREFIRASLDGDHKKARFFLLKDSINLLLIDRQQRDFEMLPHEEKKKHRESSIRPTNIKNINDSTTIYTYFNTYNPTDTTSINVVKQDDHWVVDLKSILEQ